MFSKNWSLRDLAAIQIPPSRSVYMNTFRTSLVQRALTLPCGVPSLRLLPFSQKTKGTLESWEMVSTYRRLETWLLCSLTSLTSCLTGIIGRQIAQGINLVAARKLSAAAAHSTVACWAPHRLAGRIAQTRARLRALIDESLTWKKTRLQKLSKYEGWL